MPAVDASAIQRLQKDLGGEPAVMRELLDTFLGEAPRILRSMGEALAKGDARLLNRAVHSLKSTAATFGAARLAQLCRTLEADSERQMPPDSRARVEAIEAEWKLVHAELERLRP